MISVIRIVGEAHRDRIANLERTIRFWKRELRRTEDALHACQHDYDDLRATCSLLHSELIEAKGADYVRRLYERRDAS